VKRTAAIPWRPKAAWLFIVALGAGGSGLTAQAPQASDDPGLALLQREIERLANLSGGVMGLAALHLESGRSVYLNRGVSFPMASSYKVPMSVELLTRVDRGERSLDEMIHLIPADIHPGSGTLSQLYQVPGIALSLRNLMELMLLISDNSATDVVLREAGGGEAVTARMRALGIEGIRVDRPTSLLIGDFLGVRELPEDGNVSLEEFRRLSEEVSPEEREEAAKGFDTDPRDTSTPEAMARLLEMIWRGEALNRGSSDLLLDIMRRSTTGQERIKGILPPGTEVSHKTGTIGGTTNDVGIMYLPDDAGHVVLVVFVKESTRPVPERERAIAQVSRAVYDYFLFFRGHDQDRNWGPRGSDARKRGRHPE
jgi:beta-lactamase class A